MYDFNGFSTFLGYPLAFYFAHALNALIIVFYKFLLQRYLLFYSNTNTVRSSKLNWRYDEITHQHSI
jgi:hypothetical protein